MSRLMAVGLTLLLVEALPAPALAQVFTGGPNSDFITGTKDADTLLGLAGDDTIYGSTGRGFLVGPAGDNFRDDVRCGPGEDTGYANKFDHGRINIPRSCENVETINEDPPEANPTH